MNILIYNFEDYTFDDLESFSKQVESVTFFAFSHEDVRITIKNRNIDKVIFRIITEDDLELLQNITKHNKDIEFLVLFSDYTKYPDFENSKWYSDDIKLTELSEAICG